MPAFLLVTHIDLVIRWISQTGRSCTESSKKLTFQLLLYLVYVDYLFFKNCMDFFWLFGVGGRIRKARNNCSFPVQNTEMSSFCCGGLGDPWRSQRGRVEAPWKVAAPETWRQDKGQGAKRPPLWGDAAWWVPCFLQSLRKSLLCTKLRKTKRKRNNSEE